ncbi:EAL and HDOD domain-containing protein [Chitinimonas koreensis]|uniref:EAL and HDOD domain-containing protein n=1 Tax=Chitinimonas koreensis TaxID=356302 RepID=UPI00041730AB|nr:HDOD domain-containing protein [Chitinimonas koreensis]QNM96542.1 HDOD domain-containing protein [Chitinimonas koreensis]
MVFGLIKKIFGGGEHEPPPPSPHFAPPPTIPAVNALGAAPGQAGFVAGAPTETMLQREIVVDRDLKVVGYDFRLRESVLRRKDKMAHSVWKLYDEVLLRNFLAEESTKAFGSKRIFLDVSVWALQSALLDKLPRGRFVLMLRYDAEFFQNAFEHIELLESLKTRGFQLGFDNFPLEPTLIGLFTLADYHRLSVAERDITELSKIISAVANAAPDAELMVADIHFFEELQVCRQLQVHFLQGSYLRRKELSEADAVDASYLRLLEVLNLVRAEADPMVIAGAMKYDPMLSFKLLRYVNSPGSGLVTKVDTLDRALVVLGHKQLYRWLTLLLFAHERQEGDQDILLETALIRGRMMETLGAKQFRREVQDQLFTTGMFSMLETLLRQPMDKLIDKLNLPADINSALLGQDGPYSPLLQLALACEDGDLPDDPRLFQAAGVSKNDANRAQVEAMLWVEEVV